RLAHPGRTPPNRGEEYSILLHGPPWSREARSCFTHPSCGSSTTAGPMMESRGALSQGNAVRRVHQIRREAEQRLRRSGLVVILLGSSGRGLDERRDVGDIMEQRGIVDQVLADVIEDEIGREAF